MTTFHKYDQISNCWLDYKDALRNYILKFVKDADTANELSHEVLMKVYSSCCSGKSIRNVRSWLFQIAYHTCMDYFNKSARTVELQAEYPNYEENTSIQDGGEFIVPLLNILPQKYALPLELSDIKGMKQQEVAKKLGLSLTATKTRVQRARKLLKEEIINCFHIEVDQQGQLTALDLKGSCEPLRQFSAHKVN